MITVSPYKEQNIIDLCVQEYGSVEGLLEFAKENNLKIDEDMIAGSVLLVNESNTIYQPLVEYFNGKEIVIATGADGFVTDDTRIFGDTFNDIFN